MSRRLKPFSVLYQAAPTYASICWGSLEGLRSVHRLIMTFLLTDHEASHGHCNFRKRPWRSCGIPVNKLRKFCRTTTQHSTDSWELPMANPSMAKITDVQMVQESNVVKTWLRFPWTRCLFAFLTRRWEVAKLFAARPALAHLAIAFFSFSNDTRFFLVHAWNHVAQKLTTLKFTN